MPADPPKSLIKNTAYIATPPYIGEGVCKQLFCCNALFLQAISIINEARFYPCQGCSLIRAPQRPPTLRSPACSAGLSG